MWSIDNARLAWDVVQTVLVAGIGVHQWIVSRDRVRAKALDDLRTELSRRISHVETAVDERVDGQGERLARLETRIERVPDGSACVEHTQRLSVVEEALRHAPRAEQLREIESVAHKRMDAIAEALSELRGGIRRVEGTLDMIHQHLLSGRAHP